MPFLMLMMAATALDPAGAQAAGSDLFTDTNLLRISIEIPDAGMQILRQTRTGQSSQTKPKAEARVSEGGRVYTNVTVQLKGFTTFQPIDRLPALTLNFDKLAPKQRFHGLAKISLNNSAQDRTRLHEKLSRELFAAAGVPVPRADHAIVSLNGRELGLYVLVEGYDKEFLKRHFRRTDGNLYEGGVLQDIDRPLHVNSGKDPTDRTAVQRLIRAAREPEPERRLRALEEVLDLNRFLSMMAMETILCHSDSYSMNRNNYRLYHDPGTDKFVFMPHGMDRVLGTHRSSLDLPIVPPALGLVARAVLSTEEGRRRYGERAGVLFSNVFQPERLCRRVCEIDAKIAAEKMGHPADRPFAGFTGRGQSQDAADLCERISKRAAELQVQFTQLQDLLALAPTPAFDADGGAQLGGWYLRRRPGQPETACVTNERDGKKLCHVQTPQGPLTASLRSRISLPAGSYRLEGRIEAFTQEGSTNLVPVTVLRYSGGRFDTDLKRLGAGEINFNFQVAEARAPEELEFICELRDMASEVWFDAGSFRLERRN